MKITMLGTSESGKTTYLSAMLGILYEGAIEGLYIRPHVTQDSEVVKKIEEINTLFRDGTFPLATAEGLSFLSLSLFKNDTKLVNFDFIDYRGGDLRPLARDEQTKDLEKLSAAILASDVVLVFVDAIKLNACPNIAVARQQLGVRTIDTVLNKAKREAEPIGKKIKIIFVLSKTDASTISEDEIPALKRRVRELYSNMFAVFYPESNKFKIIEIGAVGRGNVDTIVKPQFQKGQIVVTNSITTKDLDYKPYNIASVLAQAFLEGIDNVSYDIKELARILEEKKTGFNHIKQIIDFLFRGSSQRKDIRSLEIELEESIAQLKSLQRYRRDLVNIISNRL